jgi:hypothetical protein
LQWISLLTGKVTGKFCRLPGPGSVETLVLQLL